MKEPKKRLKTLLDYKGRVWREQRNGLWSCYDDNTGKTRSGLPEPDPSEISLDTDELKGKK
jgi:hypothetical protein